MNNFFIRSKKFVVAHKLVSALVVLVVLYGGYKWYVALTDNSGVTKYVFAAVEKQTIVTSVSGSGQVSTSNQIDLKPKAAGSITGVYVSGGQEVKAGALVASIDATDAAKTVRDAEVSLETAKLSLAKLKQPPDQLSLTQSQNALAHANTSKQNAQDDLDNAHDDGFNSVASAFLDLPAVMTGLHDMLFTPSAALGGLSVNNIDFYRTTALLYDPRAADYGADVASKYQIALTKYNQTFTAYKALTRTSDTSTTEATILETYEMALALSDAVKSTNNLIQFYEDQSTQHDKKPLAYADTHLATLNTYTGKVTTHLTDLLSVMGTIKNEKNAILDADRSIAENTQSFAKLQAGTDVLDLRSSEIAVTQKENALLDARQKLADYYVRAPFDGTIAKLSVKKFDSASAGTAVATLVTTQKIAEISLNEVDAAKIKVGQKATITFDAIDGLSIAGTVSEIDTMGTVTQGVVTYAVKIAFDTQDDRVKSGMSVSAAIITDAKQDVLAVPLSAVKASGSLQYVQVLDNPPSGATAPLGIIPTTPLREVTIETGLSNDTTAEVVSAGLKEGDMVVVRTITAVAATTQAPSLIGGGGGNRALRGG